MGFLYLITSGSAVNFAIQEERAILTLNRYDFIQLHRLQPNHSGIDEWANEADLCREMVLIRIRIKSSPLHTSEIITS